jgi:hypothetical protein
MEVEEASLLAFEPQIKRAFSIMPSLRAGLLALREKFGSGSSLAMSLIFSSSISPLMIAVSDSRDRPTRYVGRFC